MGEPATEQERVGLYVCGACASDLRDRHGAETPDGVPISLGVTCANPTHAYPPQATSFVTVESPIAWRSKPPTEPFPPPWTPLETAPTEIGPLTEIATRLLCAWGTGNVDHADDVTAKHAVALATQILTLTGGK